MQKNAIFPLSISSFSAPLHHVWHDKLEQSQIIQNGPSGASKRQPTTKPTTANGPRLSGPRLSKEKSSKTGDFSVLSPFTFSVAERTDAGEAFEILTEEGGVWKTHLIA